MLPLFTNPVKEPNISRNFSPSSTKNQHGISLLPILKQVIFIKKVLNTFSNKNVSFFHPTQQRTITADRFRKVCLWCICRTSPFVFNRRKIWNGMKVNLHLWIDYNTVLQRQESINFFQKNKNSVVVYNMKMCICQTI